MKQIGFLIVLIILFNSCLNKNPKVEKQNPVKVISQKSHDDKLLPENEISSNNYNFFADSVLHGHKEVLKYYFKKYIPDSCNHLHLEKKGIVNNFEGLESIGDINHDHIQDSVFVLEPISYCKFEDEKDFEGDAYYFTDTTLPRLQTSSECCHPKNIFNIGDIDEDGVSEIGQFFSSCASRYKSLYVYSLKKGKWKEVGHSGFDLFYMDVDKPFSHWVRKTGKNKFEMLQITDLTEKNRIGKKDWLKFTVE